MKFKQKLNKLKFILPATMMLTGLSLTSVINEKIEQVNAEQEKVEFKQDNKRLIQYDDDLYVITLSVNELNTYIFNNLADTINNDLESTDFSGTSINCNTVLLEGNADSFRFDDYESDSDIVYVNYDDSTLQIYFYIDGDNNFVLYKENTTNSFDNQLVWNLNGDTYQHIKTAIELDIQANNVNIGDSITEAITSGLGLVPDLANEFLGGFTALFWDATANNSNGSLTTFSYFALIFLGIAITMAVIKLVLSIIRGSTGA